MANEQLNATLKLYNVPFTQEDNFILDEPLAYLNSLTPVTTVEDFQFSYPEMKKTIKVRLKNDATINSLYGRPTFNYVVVEAINEYGAFTTNRALYFVDDVQWIDSDTLRLSLSYDTLNGFVLFVPSRKSANIPWEDHTHIIREHRDRWRLLATSGSEKTIAPIIDDYPENISPTLVKTKDQIIKESGDIGAWYMVYVLSGESIAVNFSPDIKVQGRSSGSGSYSDISAMWDWVDFSQDTLWKVVEIPYCPLSYTVTTLGGLKAFTFNLTDSINALDSSGLKIKSLNWTRAGEPALRNMMSLDFNRQIGSVKLPVGAKTTAAITRDVQTFYGSTFETKFYNSEFMVNKFVYGACSYQVKCELLKDVRNGTIDDIDEYFTITITQLIGKTLTNELGFKFQPESGEALFTEDFENFMLINRNNEVPIYSSAFLDYVRNGYNYDKQIQTLSLASQLFSLGTNLGEQAMGGNQMGVLKSAVQGASSIGQTSLQNQKSYAELRRQSISVAGSGDLTMFKEYTSSKLHYIQYEPIAHEKQELSIMFHLHGYATSKYAVPNTHTRLYFNYVQCDAEFLWTTTRRINDTIVTDVKQRFSQGVTFLHAVNGSYDFERKYENWENALLN